ncbi:FYVE, RhoGEF and PH domain-containing protein 5 [Echinops telfairi]|uniref:FYVE, RhoGEF and PH domain-containing protein 5 n=1 Tax=Echinops telfairi TaxID=9371 RepID=A0AC55D2V2_ECHTE|nr:FYVE, RhoGEF and PH domain-containing protein 5 [Echinops telfairi]
MFRGPKPPIAPKPRLGAPHEWRASVYINNSLNKCSNGKLLCVDRGLYEGHQSNLECSESEVDEDYIVAPQAALREGQLVDGGSVEDDALVPPAVLGDEEPMEEGDECDVEGMGASEDVAALAEAEVSGESDGSVDQALESAAGEEDSKEAGEPELPQQEEVKLVEEHDASNWEDKGPWDKEEVFENAIILTQVESEDPVAPVEAPTLPETPLGLEEDSREDCAMAESGDPDAEVDPNPPTEGDAADASEGPPEEEELASDVQGAEVAVENLDVPKELGEDATEGGGQADDAHPNSVESTRQEEMAVVQETDEDTQRGEDTVQVQEEAAEESCHIVPFENDSVDGFMASLTGSPYEFFPTETNPYAMGVGLACWVGQCETQAGPTALSGYGMREEMNSDVEGSLLSLDRKNLIPRVRPHSGKVAGYVPETVPEEIGPEAGSTTPGSREAVLEVRKTTPEATSRALPAKPRAFTLYPRSFSVEGREIPFSLFHEPEALDDRRMKREENLSLPCVIGSSGSFSQRNHLPSSGTSTPSSVVDIPPPFDLACITKKPITKSSPSLLIESDSPDKYTKKKKSSFKQFLALTFKKKTESKVHVEVNVSSSRSSSESSYHGPSRLLEMDRRSLSNSPQLKARTGKLRASESPSSLIFYRDGKRRGVPFSRTVSRVESFEDRSRPAFLSLPLTKPRSISFPNADTSDYENIPAMNSDYENIQIPPRRPTRAGTFTKLFEDQSRALSTANENDGYVDMSSFNAFESKQQSADQEAESAYTEPYKVCPISAAAPKEDLASDEEKGSSEEEEEEESAPRDPSLTYKVEGQSRAQAIAQELLSSEKAYVEMLQHLHLDFHGAVVRTLDEMDQEGRDPLSREALRLGLSLLPAIHDLHRGMLEELEQRLEHWEGQQKVADIFLARELEFEAHATHILQFDRFLGLLSENCLHSPRLAVAVRVFEQSLQDHDQSVKHRLLRVVQRLFQYQVLLTDYLNNLCPDSAEYENTQGALALISKVTGCVNDNMEQGENLQKLVHIEHSVRGQGDLLQPGREFLKEGTLMKVTGKSRRPRHLFLVSTWLSRHVPGLEGKSSFLPTLMGLLLGFQVSRPVMDKVPYALRIETPESCLTLSASSCAERDEWYSCLGRALPEDYKAQALAVFHHSVEMRERLGVNLGERPPTLVPVTHVMMCMNCGCDFSLTLRRHHCHACGKIVCRNCSRNKYPLKYLKDRLAKVCDGCYGKLKKRGGDIPGLMRERPVSMSFPLSSPRFSSSAFSSVFHSINSSTFKKPKKVPSALAEVAASGEGSAISGYLNRYKKGKRHWKKLWFVIKGKVLYTYMASEDKVAVESMPLLGFTIAPEKQEGSSEVGPIFHLYHKKTLFYSFKAEDTNSAQRWIEAMEDASVL